MYIAQTTKDRIKQICKDKKINVKQMLSDCSLGANAIQQINDTKGMASFSLARIADYLDCSVDYLLGRTDNPEIIKTERRNSFMPDNLHIDFDKISSDVQNIIDNANCSTLVENPNANINEIDRTAKIAKAVCLSALQAYHNELQSALRPHGTTDE